MFHRTDTYLGFWLAWLEQVPMVSLYLIYLHMFVLLFIGLKSYINGIASDFQTIVDNLNEKLIGDNASPENHEIKLMDSLWKEAIILHNDMLRYVTSSIQLMFMKINHHFV